MSSNVRTCVTTLLQLGAQLTLLLLPHDKSCSYKRPYERTLRPTLALRLTTLGRTPETSTHDGGTSKTFTGTK